MEYHLPAHLIVRAEHLLTRRQLIDTLWGDGDAVNLRTIDVHVGRIRKALRSAGDTVGRIRTVRTSDYSFTVTGGAFGATTTKSG